MVGKIHIFAAVTGSILAVCLAGAQTRGEGSSVRMPAAAVRPAVRFSSPSPNGAATRTVVVRPAARFRVVTGNRVISGGGSFPHPAGNDGGIGVPGLGFDYPHLAAVSGGLRGDEHRGFGHSGNRGQGFMTPIFFGGYPYYYDGSLDYEQPEEVEQTQAYPMQAQPQPQIIVIQQPVPAVATQSAAVPQDLDTGGVAGKSSPAAHPAAEAPVQRMGEIILIRKDGRVLFASAFSVVGTQLRYISVEGILQKFPVAELDAEATEQMNEARGNSVQISD